MMSKDFLKKAGILGVSFGLMASPLAFAQTTDHSSIETNQDAMEEQPMGSDSQGTSGTGNYDQEDLTTDHGTEGPDTVDDPESTDMSDDEEYTPEEIVEENSAS